MEEMFSGAWAFRGDLSKWDVAQVRDFRYMFDHAYDFNSDLSSWTTSSASVSVTSGYQPSSQIGDPMRAGPTG